MGFMLDDFEFEKISKDEAKKNYQKLKNLIKKLNKEYYEENSPSVSDAEFDQLFLMLNKIEEKFPDFIEDDTPTKTVGSKPSSKFKKITHTIPMLSLSNIFSDEDLEGFIKRIKNYLMNEEWIDIFLELKIDGVSFSARYENGNLKYVSTRGDGVVGEDITENMKTLEDFPQYIANIAEIFEIRGEVYFTKEDFANLNDEQRRLSKQIFSNPRNAASGSIRQLDPSITASRPLKYFVYSLGYVSEKTYKNQADIINSLPEMGFSVCNMNKICKNIDEIKEFYSNIKTLRDNLDFEIDGIVLKVNDFDLQERLGFVGRTPRWATAYKFPAHIGSTYLKSVSVQIGRTGALTPVAELEPINISGVNISRATLHNFNEISRLGLKIGDKVFLERAGDVIPKITFVDLSKRQEIQDLEDIKLPEFCPSCNSRVFYEKDEAILRCENGLKCPAQRKERLIHFVSKNAMNIDGLGKKQIEFLLENEYIANPVDIFNLKFSDKIEYLKREEGWGITSVNNLLNSIEISKNISFDKFIFSLGIRHIGSNNAKILASYFANLKNLISMMNEFANMSEEFRQKFLSIDGFGDKIINAIEEFFVIEENRKLIIDLNNILTIPEYQLVINGNSQISGKIVVFTGSLENLSRSEAKNTAEKLGAKVASAVSKNTDYVIAGSDSGSKLKKAQELGVKILSEQEWVDLISAT